ncbi:exopolyphosphatase [Crocinitomicaceae bacterium]|nr:exopolyphosphatase [Crocinitomicaceae bacterium]
MLRYAAIDIGSNAIRMLFEEVYDTGNGIGFKKLTLVRLPVRLGEDAFVSGRISDKKRGQLIQMGHSFNYLCSIFEVQGYRATATSAMRDSENGQEIIEEILEKTGVQIEIIPGEEEANILYEGILNTGRINAEESYMLIDVGGGSTEINFFRNGERVDWHSFDLGTVRLKEGIQRNDSWDEFDAWIQEMVAKYEPKYAVGTGGNINKFYKLCGHKNWENLTVQELRDQIEYLKGFTPEEMVQKLDVKRDRADVIIPGGMIYLRAMERGGIDEMIVPKVGLADGLIRRQYFEDQEAQTTMEA